MYARAYRGHRLGVEVWIVQIRRADHSVAAMTTCMGEAGARAWILAQANKGAFND